MSRSSQHLKEAITGEHNAIRKYKKFAEVAEKENLPNVAYLFRGLVLGETIHIENHKRVLNEEFQPQDEEFPVGTTLENLKHSLEGESYEYKKMYPSFIKAIKKELKKEEGQLAQLSFKWAMEVELTHAETLQIAISAVSQGNDFVDSKLWVCKVCGNLYIGEQPTEICPVCKHDAVFYKEVKR